jgi:hypothetical protein
LLGHIPFPENCRMDKYLVHHQANIPYGI